MITPAQYFKHPGASQEAIDNATDLLERVNALLEEESCPIPSPKVNSGWRPPAHNAKVGGAPNSRHMTGEAIDLGDPDGKLGDWALENPEILVSHGIWCEHPEATPTWLHCQIVPPRSGMRFFYP